MKTIYLIRHAKSSWSDFDSLDFDRKLNRRGKHDAPLMGNMLKELDFTPDLILASPSKRTTLTGKLICKNINYSFDQIQFERNIYDASLADLIQLINNIPSQHETVALIGHNPGITFLSNYLTDDFISNIPTCGIVKIELEIEDWNEVIKGIGIKKYFIYPKMYY